MEEVRNLPATHRKYGVLTKEFLLEVKTTCREKTQDFFDKTGKQLHNTPFDKDKPITTSLWPDDFV